MKNNSNTSRGESGIITVGPTDETNGLIVTHFKVDVHLGGALELLVEGVKELGGELL